MKARAVVRLKFSSQKQLQVVMASLKPETDNSTTSRSDVRLNADGLCLVLDFRATDTSALRAAMNSYLRLVGVAMNLHELTE